MPLGGKEFTFKLLKYFASYNLPGHLGGTK